MIQVGDVVFYRGESKKYLTPGKLYTLLYVERNRYSTGFEISDDTGERIFSLLKGSGHLNGGNWKVYSYEQNLKKILK